MTRNPFVVNEEFLKIKADSSMKDDFHLLALEKFWIKTLPVNSTLASLALRILKLNGEIVLMSIAT
ncbi:unnamed protein product [Acanthoscelides obtectus]|uniref:Uncharacterized protein n=1 Tax=Acanthoscelides obtectus TaxID=200917 RepID=A0A9P0MM84_ACAOB|nr:unnamed protein product [Acanthoscelides obtectus]CAK1683548.1 hypothetical protein AOBTE_LOCUS34305 [Acanthoscelides obtectus]